MKVMAPLMSFSANVAKGGNKNQNSENLLKIRECSNFSHATSNRKTLMLVNFDNILNKDQKFPREDSEEPQRKIILNLFNRRFTNMKKLTIVVNFW